MNKRESHKQVGQLDTQINDSLQALHFYPDTPLSNPEQDDLLDHANPAKHIAHAIADNANTASLVVGIYGRWGSGKSTMLNFIDYYLSEAPSVIRLRFNPWTIGGEEELLLAFMTSLAHAVNVPEKPRSKRIAGTAAKILEYASVFARLGSLDPRFAPIVNTAADASKGIADRLKELSSLSLDREKALINQGLEKQGKRVVVLMDDLDRLDKRELRTVIKLVKLVADFSCVTYVLAFDDTAVARSIGETYTKAASVDDAEKAGKEYLEKIVQVPIRLSVPTEPALRSMALTAVSESVNRYDKMLEGNSGEERRLVSGFDLGILPFVRTPRRAKQIGTRVDWALSMMAREINTADVVLLEALAVCQPRVYELVLDRPDLFCQRPREGSDAAEISRTKGNIKVELESHMETESDGEHDGGWLLLHNLFPRTEWITGNTTYGPDSDSTWERDQRVASEKYLKRYIHMTIPETDVSDVAVQKVIEELPHVDTVQGKALLGSILTSKNAQTLIFKLKRQAETLDESSAAALAHAVALLSDRLPEREGFYAPVSAAWQGPYLVRGLLARIGDLLLRKRVALEILGESASLRFAREVFREIQYRQPEPSNSTPSLFDEQSSKDLADVVVGRIRDMAEKEKPIYAKNPNDAQHLLPFWDSFGPKNEARDYVAETIRADPLNAVHLLRAFVGTGEIHRGSLDADTFAVLSRIVDVAAVCPALEKAMGTTLSGDKPDHMLDDVDDRQLAEQFVWFCKNLPKSQDKAT